MNINRYLKSEQINLDLDAVLPPLPGDDDERHQPL